MKLGNNPFEIYPKHTKKRYVKMMSTSTVVDKKTGELNERPDLSEMVCDTTKYVKVYDFDKIRELTKHGFRMLCYMAKVMDYENSANIDIEEMMNTLSCSKTHVYRALEDLARNGIIKQRNPYAYWVNPNIMCKGKRDMQCV